MAAVGLLFVGAVLFVNALLLLGKVDGKSAAPFNLFVGGLQTVVPFYLIATADTEDEILLAWGSSCSGSPTCTWGSRTRRTCPRRGSAGTACGW